MISVSSLIEIDENSMHFDWYNILTPKKISFVHLSYQSFYQSI